VDTAVCIARDGEVLHESLLGLGPDGSPRHSTALLGEIERAVEMAGGWAAVDAIAVGLGPGSFTGIRIAIATARGLGASTRLPVSGVCTLDAVGRAIGERAGGERSRLAVLDARRGEVFAALYSPAGERLWDPLVAPPEELAKRAAELPESPLCAGPGAVRFRDELANRGLEVPEDAAPLHRIDARHVCALAGPVADASSDNLEPIYLRNPDAERWRERDTFPTAE
jgi:tRNA threonylcarbamoyladenosine biosynthesis protein TsaB